MHWVIIKSQRYSEHTELLEADLRDIGIELRDYYNPKKDSATGLTTRVLLQVIEYNLDRDNSRYWSKLENRSRFQVDRYMMADLLSATIGDEYWLRKSFYDVDAYNRDNAKKMEEADKKSRIQELMRQEREQRATMPLHLPVIPLTNYQPDSPRDNT